MADNEKRESGIYTPEEVLKMAADRGITIRETIQVDAYGRYTTKEGKNGVIHTFVTNYDEYFFKYHDIKKFPHIPWNMIGQTIVETVPKEFAIGRNKEMKGAVEEVLNNRKRGIISAEEAIMALQKWFDKVANNED